jgi:hypothetical protein
MFHPIPRQDIVMEDASDAGGGSLDELFLPAQGQYRIVYQPVLTRTLHDPGVSTETRHFPRERALGIMMMIWSLWPDSEEAQQHIRVYLRTSSGQRLLNPAAVWSNNSIHTVKLFLRHENIPTEWVNFLFSLARDNPLEFTILVKGSIDTVLFQAESFEFIEGLLMVCMWFQQNPGDRLSRLYQYVEPLEMF